MAWGCNKLDAESAEIEHYSIENINVGLTSVASARADLSEFERAAKDPVRPFGKAARQSQRFSFAQNQIVPVARGESILRRETDRSFGTCVGTLWTEQTATKIEPQASILGDRVGRASIYATRTTRRTPGLVDCRKPTKSLRQNWLDLRKW